MNTELLIMAAGMGSRFGGLKQIAPIGPNGEIILDLKPTKRRLAQNIAEKTDYF